MDSVSRYLTFSVTTPVIREISWFELGPVTLAKVVMNFRVQSGPLIDPNPFLP